jgi:ADP-heptose:LPS heptosyltransferase
MLGIISKALRLRLRSLLLTLASSAYAVVRGNAKSVTHDPKCVVVTHFTNNLGDMVCATPILRAIKKRYPHAHLVVVGSRKNGELLAGLSDVDEYIPIQSTLSMILQLRRLKPEWGIAVNPSPHEVGVLFLSGTKSISSFTYPKSFGKAFEVLSRMIVTVPYEPGKYVPREYLKLLTPLGIDDRDTQKHLAVDTSALSRMRDKLTQSGIDITKPIVVIAPTTGQTYKEWPYERFALVAQHCKDVLGASVAVIGAPQDAAVVQKVVTAIHGPAYNGVGDGIEDLKALLSLAKLIVAGDTGTVYMAEAFGVAAVVIIGVTDPIEHPLNDATHKIVMPKAQEFVLRSVVSNYDDVDVDRALAHLQSIPVEAVVREVDSVWHAQMQGALQ